MRNIIKSSLFFLLLLSSYCTYSQNVYIPDTNFKNYLLAQTAINTDSDKANISVAEAKNFKGFITVRNKGIKDMTGIEAFTDILSLDCGNNPLTKPLDIRECGNLSRLKCDNNNLTSLDLSKNKNLNYINISKNKLQSINLKNQTFLSTLYCNNNQLQSLDISDNGHLTQLYCFNNQIDKLDVSNNLILSYLSCNNNLLTSLTVGNNTRLSFLNCNNNNLTSLNVSSLTSLISFNCSNNELTSLVLGRHNLLEFFNCDQNKLENLDVRKYPSLNALHCHSNSLKSLDVSKNTKLTSLSASSNQIEVLNLNLNTKLKNIACENNLLNSLNLKNNPNLSQVTCHGNRIVELDFTANKNLRKINCGNSIFLNKINLKNGNNRKLQLFQAKNTPNLSCLLVDNVANFKLRFESSVDNKNVIVTTCPAVIKVQSITVKGKNNVSAITTKGGTLRMEKTVLPANATNQAVTWSVDNTAVATINATSGILKAVKDGTVTVKAAAKDGSGKFGTKKITISNQNPPIPVQSITVKGKGNVSAITTKGGTLRMEKTVLPANATNQAVTWSVDNTAVATINATSGILKAVKDGTVTVKATAKDGSGKFGTKKITISNQNPPIPVQSITVKGKGNVSAITTKGGTLRMEKTVLPANATNQAVTWSVDNTAVATINATSGILKAVKDGTVTVKATAKDGSGKFGTKKITISNQNPPILVQSITVKGKGNVSAITTKGGTLRMEKTVLPANATNQAVTWSVDNTAVATINATSGILKAVKDGTVTVKATAKDGSGKFGTTKITISNQNPPIPVQSITVKGKGNVSAITTKGGTLRMEKTVLPANATNQAVTWSVDNTAVATINATSGILKAVKDGTVTVKATAKDGSGKSGTKKITISNQNVTSIISKKHDFVLYPNPVRDRLTIDTDLVIRQIEITDLAGKVISKPNIESKNIDVSTLSTNLYLIRIHTDSEVFVEKFAKE